MIPSDTTYLDGLIARSAGDLLADLCACRQLRHLTDAQRDSVVRYFFADDGRVINRSGYFYAWTYEALEIAFGHFGCSCDCCSEVSDVPEINLRRLADRALDNMDGRVRLILCKAHSKHFRRFCHRYFDAEVRVPYTRELEKMMVAWLAFEVRQIARKVAIGAKDERPTAPRRDANNRFDKKRRDDATDSQTNGRVEEHHREVPAASKRERDFVSLRQAGSSSGLVLGTL